MNDKANIAIQSLQDSHLKESLLKCEGNLSSAWFSYQKRVILREQVTLLAMAMVKMESDIASSLKGLIDDKAGKAVEGITPGQTGISVNSAESEIREHCAKPDVGLDELDVVLDYMRLEIKLLALAYTKALSDMNAMAIQQAQNENFALSMGDAFKFQTYMMDHYKATVLAHPELKFLEVAQLVMESRSV
jgi:hypothetical protein